MKRKGKRALSLLLAFAVIFTTCTGNSIIADAAQRNQQKSH